MRVLLTATSYPRTDGDWQGIFIKRMCDALATSGDVKLRVWAPAGPADERSESALTGSDRIFLSRLQAKGGIAHALRTTPVAGMVASVELLLRMGLALHRERFRTDVLHLNWLQCVLAAGTSRLPMLVTVLGTDLALMEKPWIRALVRRALSGKRVVLCPNAEWMVPVLRRALGDAAQDIRYVPFGLDRHWYNVQRHPAEGPREWITVLRLTRAKIGRLFEWTRDIDPERDRFHLFGPMQEQMEVPPWISYHGAVTPDVLAARWYPRATGMISLSEHDEGRPQVLLEALASGVPVVCSRIPAHENLLESVQTGYLVESKEEFLSALSDVALEGATDAIAERGRAATRSAYGTWEDCAGRYLDIYRELTAGGCV